MKKTLPILAVAATLSLASCNTTSSLYSWHNYEDATYQYSKKATDELQVKVLEHYKKLTEVQKGTRGVVPPGMYADLPAGKYSSMYEKDATLPAGKPYVKATVK